MYPQSSSCCSSGVSKGNPENRIIECGSITLIVFVVMPALSKIPRVMQAHGKSDPKFHEWSFRLVTPRDHQQAGKCEANYCFAARGNYFRTGDAERNFNQMDSYVRQDSGRLRRGVE